MLDICNSVYSVMLVMLKVDITAIVSQDCLVFNTFVMKGSCITCLRLRDSIRRAIYK